MSTASAALSDHGVLGSPKHASRVERIFFGSVAGALLIAVFVGFAPTYFLRESFGSPELTPSLKVHGLLFTTWMVLLLVQTSLIAASKTAWRRRPA